MTDFNDQILGTLGTTWWKPFPAADGWQEAPEFDAPRERARALLREKFGAAELWGWKDPRTTLTLPFWKQIVPDPLYVICLRNPADAIASIQRRPEPTLTIRQWGELWLEYTARALRETAGKRRLIVLYGDYFREPQAQMQRLASLLGLQADDERIGKAIAAIEGDLRHHRSSPLELAATEGIPAAARTVFLSLRAAQALRHGPAANREDILRICDGIERVTIDEWWAQRVATSERQSSMETERALTDLQAELHSTHAQIERYASDLAQAQEREQDLQSQLSHTQKRLDSSERTLAGLETSLSWRLTSPLRASKRSLISRRRRRPNATAF